MIESFFEEEDTLECKNCQEEYTDSDAEEFEDFCCATCEGEYLTDIDSDEKAEYKNSDAESLALETALEEHREKKELK